MATLLGSCMRDLALIASVYVVALLLAASFL